MPFNIKDLKWNSAIRFTEYCRKSQIFIFLLLLVFLPLRDVNGIVNVSLALALIALIPDYRNLYPIRYVILAWGAFSLWYFASSFWSGTPEHVYSGLRKEILYSFICFILSYSAAAHLKSLRPVIYATIISLILLTLSSASRGMPGFMPFMTKYYPAVGDGSTSLVFYSALAIAFLCSKNKALIYLGLIISLISFSLGLFYENRMFFMTLGAMIASAILYKTHILTMRAKLCALAGITIIGFVTIIFSLSIKSNTQSTNYLDNAITIAKKDPRIFMWDFYINKGLDKPILGYGAGYHSIKNALWEQFPENFNILTKDHAHNVFINKWLQTGGIGLTIFLALYFSTFIYGARKTKLPNTETLTTAFILIFIGFFVKSTTDDFFIRNNLLIFWSICGLTIGTKHSKNK